MTQLETKWDLECGRTPVMTIQIPFCPLVQKQCTVYHCTSKCFDGENEPARKTFSSDYILSKVQNHYELI